MNDIVHVNDKAGKFYELMMFREAWDHRQIQVSKEK